MFAIRHSRALLLLGIICLSAWTHGRSISMVGDVIIEISGDKFICDKIECPKNADRCVVIKEKDPNDASILVRSDTCYSKTNEVLKKSVMNETVDPNLKINLHIEANRDGVISSLNSYSSYSSSDFDEDKFQKEFSQEMAHFHHNLDKEMKNLNKELSNMGKELDNMFG